MNVQGNKCIVIASLGDITADLPQGNDILYFRNVGRPFHLKMKSSSSY